MSLPNVFSGIGSFFSNVFRPVTNVLSGGFNAVAGIPQDIENFGQSVVNGFNTLASYLAQIPDDILNFFSQIPGAIMGGLHLLGSWVMGGLQTLGSAIAGGIKSALSTIMDFAHYIATLFQPLISFVMSVVNYITNTITSLYNTLSNLVGKVFTIINDSISISVDFMTYAINLASNFSKFVQDGINLVTSNALDLVTNANTVYKHFTDSAPFNILKQESSRFAKATGKLIGFNTAMEVMKETIRRSWYTQNMNPLVRALMIATSPILGGFTGFIAETMFKAFYPGIELTTITRYLPPTTRQSTFPYHTTHASPPTVLKTSYATTLSSLPGTPPSPAIQGFRPGHIITVYIEDLISLPGTASGLTATGGFVTASQYAQTLSDTLNIEYELVTKLVPTLSFSVVDETSPLLLANITTSVSELINTLTVNTVAEIGQLFLPLGARICTNTTEPQGYISGDSLVDYLDVDYSICMNIGNVKVEFMYLFVTTEGFPPNLPTTVLELEVTTENFPPNLPTTSISLLVTTQNFPPNLPTTEVSITVSPQTPPFTGVTTVPYILNGITTYFGFQGYALSTTATPGATICFKNSNTCQSL